MASGSRASVYALSTCQESGGKHVGVFEGKIIMAGRVLIVLTIIAVASLLIYQVGFRGVPMTEVPSLRTSKTRHSNSMGQRWASKRDT